MASKASGSIEKQHIVVSRAKVSILQKTRLKANYVMALNKACPNLKAAPEAFSKSCVCPFQTDTLHLSLAASCKPRIFVSQIRIKRYLFV